MTALSALLLSVAMAVLTMNTGRQRDSQEKGKMGPMAHRRATTAYPLPSPPPSEGPQDMSKLVTAALADWRTAILVRDADAVTRLDATFLESPATYVDALRESASTDGNDRVRAFSTRELGKLKRVDLIPAFERLLGDNSPFVRKNAAWALAELGSRTEDRTEARRALAELRHVAARDPSEDVRAAARSAVDQLK